MPDSPMSWRQQWRLVLLFFRQEFIDKHKEEVLGLLWVFLQPVGYILVYMLVFSHLMGARMVIPGTDPEHAYALYLVSGVLSWQLFANVIQRTASAYQAKSALIRKVPISLTIMPVYIVMTEVMVYAISMLFFLMYLLLILQHGLDWNWLWLIPSVVLLALLAYTLGLLVAILSTFLPDLRLLVQVAVPLGFWLTPIVYLSSILPAWAQSWMALNPVWWAVAPIQQTVLMQEVEPASLHNLLLLDAGMVLLVLWLHHHLQKDIRDLL